LTVKVSLIFGKRFTILKIVNCFSKLYSSFLHACLISNCRNPAIVSSWNLADAGIRQHPATENLPASESGDIWPTSPKPADQIPSGIRPWSEAGRIWPNLDGSSHLFGWIRPKCPEPDRLWQDSAIDPAKPPRRNPATATGLCQIPATVARL
jgi:hypothetical protein